MRSFLSNVAALAWKEAALLRHDRAFLSMIVAQPVMMFLLFGFALSNEPANLPWVVLDQDRTAASRRLVAEIEATGYFLPHEIVSGWEEGRERLRRGEALGFLVLPRDLARDLERGGPTVELLLDGSDPLQAARMAGIVSSVARHARLGDVARPAEERLEVRGHVRFNPTLEDHVFFLAILAGMLLTNLCISVTSLGLVGEREAGTYEQTLSLPTRAVEIVLGKLVPHVVVSYGMLAFATIAPGVVFGLWPRGSVVALVLVTLPFVLASLSIGVFVSILSRTSAQSVFISVFAIMPSMVLSGVMLPYQLMPPGIREIGFLLPLRWYQIALRRIIIRGAGLDDVWMPMLAMSVMFAVVLAAIRWRLQPRLA